MTDQWSDCREVFYHARKTAALCCRRRRVFSPRSACSGRLGVPRPWVRFRLQTRFTPGLLGHDRRCAREIAHWCGAQDVVASARLRRSPETAILRATIPCRKTPTRHHRRARAPPTSMRWHEERYEAHKRPDRRSSRALVHWSAVAQSARLVGLRRHFRTHKNGPKNGSKQRSRSAGAPQGLVAAVAAPRSICEAFLSTMITAATASRARFGCSGRGQKLRLGIRLKVNTTFISANPE